MQQNPILIVEDEPDIAELIEFHLSREGFPTRIAPSGRVAMDMIRREPPRLVVLDIMLPDLDGLEVCRRLRRDARLRRIPVILVTARGEESDVVTGLEVGAEDYITKPFSPKVLIARVRAVLRRADGDSTARVALFGGAIVIDPATHSVTVRGEEADLTLTQHRLLAYLAARPGFVRTRDQIVAAIRGEGVILSSRVVDVHVAALRQKLGDLGDCIETVRGVGYRLTEPAAPGV